MVHLASTDYRIVCGAICELSKVVILPPHGCVMGARAARTMVYHLAVTAVLRRCGPAAVGGGVQVVCDKGRRQTCGRGMVVPVVGVVRVCADSDTASRGRPQAGVCQYF